MNVEFANEAAWSEAVEMWLSRQKSKNTVASYRTSLEGLLKHSGKGAWEISRKDISAWLAELNRQGLGDASVATRISAIKSFYNFVLQEYVTTDWQSGEEFRLRDDNPAASFKLPHVERYGKAVCWDEEMAGAFLRAIDTSNLPGMRDKALFTGYLLTGLRNSELRCLRYEDMESIPGGMVLMRYEGKGKKNQSKELYPPVYEAIMAYAKAEGKFEGYVFHRYGPQGQAIDLPISDQAVRDSLKYYARHAGLRTTGLKVHSLRHTAAYLRAQAGDDLDTIRRFLKQNNVSTTQIYLQKLKPKSDKAWVTIADWLGLEK